MIWENAQSGRRGIEPVHRALPILGIALSLVISRPAAAQFTDQTVNSANDLIQQERSLQGMCNSAACFGGAGAAGGAVGMNGALAAQRMLQNGVAAIGTQMLLDALFDNGADEAAAAAAQAQAEAEAKARAEAEARRTDGVRDRLLTQMQGVSADASQNLPLMGADAQASADGSLPLMQSDTAPGQTAVDLDNSGSRIAAAMQDTMPTQDIASPTPPPAPGGAPNDATPRISSTQKVALIPRQGDPAHPARGSRYVDCAATRKAYIRLQSGLGAQRDWLKRTKAQLDGDRAAGRVIDQQTRTLAFNTVLDTTKDLMFETGILKDQLSRLQLDKLTPERQKMILEMANNLMSVRDVIEKMQKSYEAGYELGAKGQEISSDAMEQILSSAQNKKYMEALPKLAHDFGETAMSLEKALVDSGIAEEAGKNLSKAGGPWGVVAFTALKIGLEASEVIGNEYLNGNQTEQAYLQYDYLSDLYKHLEERVTDDHADLAQYCGGDISSAPRMIVNAAQ